MATVLAFVAAAAVSQTLKALELPDAGIGECSATLPSFPDAYYFTRRVSGYKAWSRQCCPRFQTYGTSWSASCYGPLVAPSEQLDLCAVADEDRQCCVKTSWFVDCVHFQNIENQEALCNSIDGAQWCGNPEKSASPQLTGAQTGSIASGAVLGGVFVATSIAVARSKP